MRYIVSLALIAIAQMGAAWAIGEPNVARPGATYATTEAATPAACERLCTDDGLCMAWSFQANSCELKAVVPAAIPQDGVISGVSHRAPAALRARYAPVQEPATPQARIEFAEAAPAPVEDEISMALLGGPEPSN
ncbi:MAG: PAN domain-containing protein [Hyphomonadaceae bacterium]